ncbi:hypothetical protein GCM10017687_79740 [Streptomyces echinatus]
MTRAPAADARGIPSSRAGTGGTGQDRRGRAYRYRHLSPRYPCRRRAPPTPAAPPGTLLTASPPRSPPPSPPPPPLPPSPPASSPCLSNLHNTPNNQNSL